MPSTLTLSPHLHTFLFTHPLDYLHERAIGWMRKLQQRWLVLGPGPGSGSNKTTRKRIAAAAPPPEPDEDEDLELREWE